MIHRTRTIACAFIAALIVLPHASAQDTSELSVPVARDEKVLHAIANAEDPYQARDGYKSLFGSADPDRVRLLQRHSSDTIAVQSAWQEIELTLPVEAEAELRPDPTLLARFIGFLEGRGRVQAPQWWVDAILDARANCRGNVYAGGLSIEQFESEQRSATPPPQTTFGGLNGRTVVRVGDEAISISAQLRKQLGPDRNVSALVTESRCFVAVYGDTGHPYQLACLDRRTSRVLWNVPAWGCWWGDTTGFHVHSVEIIEQDDRVAVLGVASSGFHAEVFRVEDGANVLRFSNNYTPN